LVLRSLYRNVVGDTVLWVEPEVRCRLEARTERHQDVVRNIAFRQPNLLNPCPVDVILEPRLIDELLNVYINGSRYRPHLLGNLRGNGEVAFKVLADKLNIQRGRNTKVERLADNVCGLKEEGSPRKLLGQILSQP